MSTCPISKKLKANQCSSSYFKSFHIFQMISRVVHDFKNDEVDSEKNVEDSDKGFFLLYIPDILNNEGNN